MPIQTATTGQLADAQRIVIEQIRYTTEHSTPCINLVEKLRLPDGAKSITVPKVGQFTAAGLIDGVDMVDTQDIGMTTTSLTTSEVGLKAILTDKLVRQENEDMFRVIGRQMGDAMARKKDTDIIALFASFNGGTTLGASSAQLSLQNLGACIDFAKANKFPNPVHVVHHPSALYRMTLNSTIIPSLTQGLPNGLDEKLLKDFYKFMVNGVTVFEDGNITSGIASVGAIFSRNAACYVESRGYDGRQQRDESLRGTEQIVLADYGVFELDDTYGAPMTYDSSASSTSA
jgi:hypothetical protein